MPGKRVSAKRTAPKKESAKRERVVIDLDEEDDLPTAKKPKKAANGKKVNELAELFDRYVEASRTAEMEVDEGDDVIGYGGVEKMCEDISVALDDVALLIMAWHLGASRVGYFTREEWMKLSNFGVTNLASLKTRVPQFHKDIANPDNMKRLFMFTFNYVRESAETKVIPVDLAEAYIRLLLPHSPHTEPFCTYLLEQKADPKGYRAINMDQWKMWYEFAHSVPVNLSNYDESGAWPLVIDNYVVTRRKQLEESGMKTTE